MSTTVDNLQCIPRIQALYSQMSEKEKRIADYILEDPQRIVHSTINQISDDLDIADATVFRFCKRLGFKGYQAMKIALATEKTSSLNDIHETIQEEDDNQAVIEKVFHSNIRTIEDTLQLLDPAQLEQAVNAMLNARRIEFYGNGGSGVIAFDAHHKFMRTGLETVAYQDAHFQLMAASLLTPDDVVFLISHSGTNKDMLLALETAKEQGATTICITSLQKSPLSKQADIALHTAAQETEYRSEALSSRLAQLSIFDALYVSVSMQRKDQMQNTLQNIREAISKKRM
ncbi:DNA-binding MurR/RpiR family transcriptional regulator [Salibacterium salarium]|uniref:MurR/RpiR family transcriptional regulator n=1 Tax=Salibacterium salarium TaxID=284579 RepID=A0A3R9PB24_9BACI|nr:MurR/RpiR family transcriptional regulator [Salibacterium salarium]MDQ0297966.1 DNA-binding MurR/RpiR family transcriptional regulator [Salibacterium salarium]RSL35352.1 MurR/RpiR family transcriptional regulator [Salibacterium salarium]